MDYATPLMVADWARGHSCYFLTHNSLVYRHVLPDSHKRALAFQEAGGHAWFYSSAAPLSR